MIFRIKRFLKSKIACVKLQLKQKTTNFRHEEARAPYQKVTGYPSNCL